MLSRAPSEKRLGKNYSRAHLMFRWITRSKFGNTSEYGGQTFVNQTRISYLKYAELMVTGRIAYGRTDRKTEVAVMAIIFSSLHVRFSFESNPASANQIFA